MATSSSWPARTGLGILSIAIGFLGWQLASRSGVFSAILLPAPDEVWDAFRALLANGYGGQAFVHDIAISLARLLGGFALAAVCGTTIGLAIGANAWARRLVSPLVELYRPLPALAYYTLIILWFGVGETSKIMVLALGGFPPIVVATADAIRSVRRDRIEGARSLGLTGVDLVRLVILRSCLPQILTGMRVGFGLAFTVLVSAEMMASTSGIGFLAFQASRNADTPVVFVALIVMGTIGLVSDGLFRLAERYLVPWARHV